MAMTVTVVPIVHHASNVEFAPWFNLLLKLLIGSTAAAASETSMGFTVEISKSTSQMCAPVHVRRRLDADRFVGSSNNA